MAASAESAFATLRARLERGRGLRTFRSARFRLVVGTMLWIIGAVMLGSLLLRQAATPGGNFAIDFGDYRAASLRMLDGRSPYAPEMLVAPVPAQGVDRYRYPPPFAQLLTPISVLPFDTAAATWLALQAAAFFAGTWLAMSAAGARASWERVVWTGAALTYFYPVFDALWKGSVQGPLVLSMGLLVAVPIGATVRGAPRRPRLASVGAGALAGVVSVVRLTPLGLLPAVVRADRRMATGAIVGSLGVCVPSALLAPAAWADYGRVLPNLVAGSADFATNLAPATVVARLGASSAVVDGVRIAGLVLAVLLVLASIRFARSSATWPLALACAGGATLLVPAAVWYHYVAILIPVAAFGWVRARPEGRLLLVGSAVLIDVGLAFLPLASLGALLFAVSTIVVARPSDGDHGYERAIGSG